MGTDIIIARATAATEAATRLVAALEAELAAQYPPEQRHRLALDALFEPHVRFFVARVGEAPVGCGGVALFEEFGELKRMYVAPDWRGRGVAPALLRHLEAETQAAGFRTLRLETGTAQLAALRFYRREGFLPCSVFRQYALMSPAQVAGSVFMEKALPG